MADLIQADSEAAHSAALNQMRGGFSDEIKNLRQELIHFASMIELELDLVKKMWNLPAVKNWYNW